MLLAAHDRFCLVVIVTLLRLALAVDNHRRRLPRRVRRWRRSLHSLVRRWLWQHGFAAPPAFRRRRRPANRTPDAIEEKVVQLHVEQPQLGAGQLRHLAARVIGFHAARETFRKIILRRRELVVELRRTRRRQPARIRVTGPRQLWGADLTMVFVLGFVPVWIVGVVDYHGSRLVALERVRVPTAAEIARVLGTAIARHGAPSRLLTDRGSVFTAPAVADLLRAAGVTHSRTLPAHPWTNGRIERLFSTFKSTVLAPIWLVASFRQLDRFVAEFQTFYNRDRPHSAYGGRTPNEVHRSLAAQPPRGRVSYFDGRLRWYAFG